MILIKVVFILNIPSDSNLITHHRQNGDDYFDSLEILIYFVQPVSDGILLLF